MGGTVKRVAVPHLPGRPCPSPQSVRVVTVNAYFGLPGLSGAGESHLKVARYAGFGLHQGALKRPSGSIVK